MSLLRSLYVCRGVKRRRERSSLQPQNSSSHARPASPKHFNEVSLALQTAHTAKRTPWFLQVPHMVVYMFRLHLYIHCPPLHKNRINRREQEQQRNRNLSKLKKGALAQGIGVSCDWDIRWMKMPSVDVFLFSSPSLDGQRWDGDWYAFSSVFRFSHWGGVHVCERAFIGVSLTLKCY